MDWQLLNAPNRKQQDGTDNSSVSSKPSSPYFIDNWKNKKLSGLGIPATILLLIAFVLLSSYGIKQFLISSKSVPLLINLFAWVNENFITYGIVLIIMSIILFVLYFISCRAVPAKHVLENDFIFACEEQGIINQQTRNQNVKFSIKRNVSKHEARIFFNIKSSELAMDDVLSAFKKGENAFTNCTFLAPVQNSFNSVRKYPYVLILGFGNNYQSY